jgi:hypothetical protein
MTGHCCHVPAVLERRQQGEQHRHCSALVERGWGEVSSVAYEAAELVRSGDLGCPQLGYDAHPLVIHGASLSSGERWITAARRAMPVKGRYERPTSP